MGRKSISAKHNNFGPGVKEEITKSYTSSKKEELMKVINAAKQSLDNVSCWGANIVEEENFRFFCGSISFFD